MITDLGELVSRLLGEARASAHGKAAQTIVHGDQQRVTALAMASGAELGEHDSPTAATMQVLHGQAVLRAGPDHLVLRAGELAVVPTQRHDLVADGDCVLLMTVALGA